jgi:ABC-type multidrug transport system ATPase subunit
MLNVAHVTKRYGQARAVNDVSFDLAPGEVSAVIGANGAGKTTLIKCILGLVKFEGAISVDGIDLAQKPKIARRRIGYVAQSPAFHPDLTVTETMSFYADLKGVGMDEAPALIEMVGLSDQLEKTAGALSGGMRQRLALAVAMLGGPRLLVLDEPTSGLDIASRLELRELITRQRAAGTSILLSTHWMEDVPYIADTTLVLDQGKLVYSGAASALAGSGAANSRLFLRLNGHSSEAIPMLNALACHEVHTSGDWIVASCPATAKAGIVESLIASGINILDFRVEEASVEDAVLRFRQKDGGES